MATPGTRTGIKTAPGRGPALETIKRSDGGEIPFVVPINVGRWGYRAGSAGTVVIPEDARLLSVAATAGDTGATVTINGGDPIEIPATMAFAFSISSDLFNPTIVFTGTESYFIQYVAEGQA